MSLRVLKKLRRSCVSIKETCQYRYQHIAGVHNLQGASEASNSTSSSTKSWSSYWHRRNGLAVQLIGTRHYCCSPPSSDQHQAGGLQQLLEESADPNVTDGEDLVYWEPTPHRTNPLYKSPEQQAEEEAAALAKLDPRFASIILFPGDVRGSKGLISRKQLQLPVVQQMYSTASAILGFDLLETSLRGSTEELLRPQIQQPAVLVASLAAVERLRRQRPGALELCAAAVGYGVGEISALTFAGAFTFEDALRLVKVRSEAMQLAADLNTSGAVRVHCVAACRLSLVCTAAVEHCKRTGVEDPHCSVAAYLYPSCYVVAGSSEALTFMEQHSEELKLKRVVRLPDCGAFHTELMEPASAVVKQALQLMPVSKPSVRVLSTTDQKVYRTPDDIRRILPRQLRRPVLWQQTLGRLYDRPQSMKYPTTYECGPGDGLLSMLLRFNDAKAARNSITVTA